MAEPSSRAAPFLAASGMRLFGRYVLISRLGAGGQAEVWRARDQTAGSDVALKILRPALARSARAWTALEREHAIASRLDHPHILKVSAPVRDEQVAALPMELASGGDLRRLRGLSYFEIVPVLMEIAQALAYAHARGIVHRDLKPGNVLFDGRGHVRLADFGCADLVNEGEALADGSRPGVSPFTASPEQLRGEPASVADDTYGLGALAYELLSGYPPYYPRFELSRVLLEPVPALKPTRQTPEQLIEIVMAMLAKRGVERPRTMVEVSELLGATLNDTLTLTFEPPSEMFLPPLASMPTVPLEALAHGIPTVKAASPAEASATTGTPRAAEPISPPAASQGNEARPTSEPLYTFGPADPAPPSTPDELHIWPEAPGLGAAAFETAAADSDVSGAANPAEPPPEEDLDALWAEFRARHTPGLMRLEPMKHSRWPWVLFMVAAIALASVASAVWLPRTAPDAVARALQTLGLSRWLAPEGTTPSAATLADRANSADESTPAPTAVAPAQPTVTPSTVVQSQAPQPSVGPSAAAPTPVAKSDAPGIAAGTIVRTAEPAADSGASRSLEKVASRKSRKRPERPDSQPFEDPYTPTAFASEGRLLADATRAEATREYARAVQDYAQALSLDPGSPAARTGMANATARLGSGEYGRELGRGYAALGAGQLDDAHAAFLSAARANPSGREATAGLAQVSAALRAQEYVELRNRAAELESQDRFGEALQTYDAALRLDPSLSSAQQRRAREGLRDQLARRLQALLDDPQRLDSPATREQAAHLIEDANLASPGPGVRALAARLEGLLRQFPKTVHLALLSDDATEVQISDVGSFGTFSRRELDLKPGTYTVIGTRAGYRDVRQSLTVEPGQDGATVSVRCKEPN